MPLIFLSDTHLSAVRPGQLAQFRQTLARVAALGAELYVLGDLVEFWPGDDDDDPLHRELVAELAALSTAGSPVNVMQGNRDFLLGERFAQETGARLLPDFATLEVGGERLLMTHGDLLCTRDVKYQAFRRYVRDPDNQRQFLSAPLAERRRVAAQTREGTQSSMLEKDDHIMDVEQDEVLQVMREYGATTLVHGHTHRPGIHHFDLAGRPARRIVLGDWYEQGQLLLVDANGFQLQPIERFLAA